MKKLFLIGLLTLSVSSVAFLSEVGAREGSSDAVVIFRDDGTNGDKVVNGQHIKEAILKREVAVPGSTQTGAMMGSDMMSSGAMMESEMKGLSLAIRQLSPTDRQTLAKMIREYLISKGVDPAKYADMRDDIHEMRKDMKEKVKEMRKKTREEFKKEQAEMRTKIKETRENGKVNVQDITFTK